MDQDLLEVTIPRLEALYASHKYSGLAEWEHAKAPVLQLVLETDPQAETHYYKPRQRALDASVETPD